MGCSIRNHRAGFHLPHQVRSPARKCRDQVPHKVRVPQGRQRSIIRAMVHTHVSCRLHIIFSTKDRMRSIPEKIQQRLWQYIAGICRNLDLKVLAVGGSDDHAHLLIGLPATITIAECVQKVKANSSRWMHSEGLRKKFEWQEGYSAFSVSASHIDRTVEYIRNQAEHHKRHNFTQELHAILEKHGIPIAPAVPAGL